MVDKVDSSWTGVVPAKSEKTLIGAVLFCLMVLSVLAWRAGHTKIVTIAWLAFISMAAVIPWGIMAAQNKSIQYPFSVYGFCSGAMITSAAIFLIPEALGQNPLYGTIGTGAGIATGFAIHLVNQRASQPFGSIDPVVIELSIHALAAGFVMGLVYTSLPDLSLLLGVAVISHKAPAGYALARRLADLKRSAWVIFIPASGIGLTGLSVSLLQIPSNAIVSALIFGLATGLFLHIALEFLPFGAQNHAPSTFSPDASRFTRAMLSIFAGGALVLVLWVLTS